MSVFNLKKTSAKDNHSDHIEHRLKTQEHKPEKNYVTEKQLEDYSATEPTVLTEKQLEKLRGGPSGTIEARLNASNSTLVKHRNESAYKGDLNKIEEQRLANKPTEKEEYEPASETPKKMRWWEGQSSPDGLKLAQRYEPAFGPARFDILDDDGEFKEDFELDTLDDDEEDDFDISNDGDEDFFDDEVKDEEAAIADEFGIEDISDEDLNVIPDEGLDIDLDLDNTIQFKEVGFEENDKIGIVRGRIQVDEDTMGDDITTRDLIDFIVDKHPELDGVLTHDSLDFSKLDDGIVRYMVNMNRTSEAKSTKAQRIAQSVHSIPGAKKKWIKIK